MTETASHPRPQLLVSVQNEGEARLARSLGVRWIDLKNPMLGSLGCPDVATARQVAGLLAAPETMPVERSAERCQTSVALGELRTLNMDTAAELMQLFPVAKIGLSGLATSPGPSGRPEQPSLDLALLKALEKISSRQRYDGQLVLAIYADHQRAAAPSPTQVIAMAEHFGARYLLVDTFIKDGLGLFHWQRPGELAALRQQAAAIGAQLVAAGSLRIEDWPALSEAAPDIVGIRSSVCAGDRTSGLSPERIAQWLAWSAG